MKRYPNFTPLYQLETPLVAGLHEAEGSPLLSAFSGEWVQVVDGDYSTLESIVEGDSVSLLVAGQQLVIYRELLAIDGATAEICINEVCSTFGNSSSIDQRGVPVAFPLNEDENDVTITNQGGVLRLDSFLILDNPEPELMEVEAPDPTRLYVTLSDGSMAAVDQVITGGEVIQSSILAGVFALLVVIVAVLAWKD